MQTQAGWCFKGRRHSPALAPVSPEPASILGYFCITEPVLLELFNEQGRARQHHACQVQFVCVRSPEPIFSSSPETAAHSEGRYWSGSWAGLSPAGVGTAPSTLWGCFHPSTHVAGVLQGTASNTTLTGSFIKHTKSKYSAQFQAFPRELLAGDEWRQEDSFQSNLPASDFSLD